MVSGDNKGMVLKSKLQHAPFLSKNIFERVLENMNRVLVTSMPAKKNTMIMMAGIAFFVVLVVLDIIRFFTLNIFEPMGVTFDVVFLVVLFNRANAKYTCELMKDSLVFHKSSLWGIKRYEVSFRSIMGIYRYQPKLVEITKFRHTDRLQSALDAREVWTIAYTATSKSGKTENCRIYFKPGDEFLDELHRVLPNKVMMNDEKVILADLERAK